MTNEQTIASGGGSPQERSHSCSGDCPICNDNAIEACENKITDEEVKK